MHFPGVSVVGNLPTSVGGMGSIPGLGRSLGEGNDNPVQYSCLENPINRGAWWATVRGIAKSQRQLGDKMMTRTGMYLDRCLYMCVCVCVCVWHVYAQHNFPSFWGWPHHHRPGEGNGNPLQHSCLENLMVGGAKYRLQSMGSQRVRHDWATSLFHFLLVHWDDLSGLVGCEATCHVVQSPRACEETRVEKNETSPGVPQPPAKLSLPEVSASAQLADMSHDRAAFG